MKIQVDQAALRRQQEQIGARVAQIVNETVDQTADEPLDIAVDKLHAKLNGGGLNMDRAWAQNAVETLRRGKRLEIRLG